MFSTILSAVQPIRIIYRSQICKFIYSSKCICNPPKSILMVLSLSCTGTHRVAPNLHCPLCMLPPPYLSAQTVTRVTCVVFCAVHW